MPNPNPQEATMNTTSSDELGASRKQLAYLRALANRAGQTFTYPATSRDANREIRRLKRAQPSGGAERQLEHREIADAIARGPEDAARIRSSEVAGYGATATWKERS
jgi:hypothetical protein